MKDYEWCEKEGISLKLLQTVRGWQKPLETEYDVRHLTKLVYDLMRGDYSNGFCSFCMGPKESSGMANCINCQHAYDHGKADGREEEQISHIVIEPDFDI